MRSQEHRSLLNDGTLGKCSNQFQSETDLIRQTDLYGNSSQIGFFLCFHWIRLEQRALIGWSYCMFIAKHKCEYEEDLMRLDIYPKHFYSEWVNKCREFD